MRANITEVSENDNRIHCPVCLKIDRRVDGMFDETRNELLSVCENCGAKYKIIVIPGVVVFAEPQH